MDERSEGSESSSERLERKVLKTAVRAAMLFGLEAEEQITLSVLETKFKRAM